MEVVLDPDGRLAGAALDMATAVRNCVSLLEVPLEDALRFASRNPAEFIGARGQARQTRTGHRADMVAIDPETITVLATWVAGANRGGFRTDSSAGSSPTITSRHDLVWPFLVCFCATVCAATFDPSSTCPNNFSSASTAAPVFAERAYGICRGTCLARVGAAQRISLGFGLSGAIHSGGKRCGRSISWPRRAKSARRTRRIRLSRRRD